jgi:hypothetical protein
MTGNERHHEGREEHEGKGDGIKNEEPRADLQPPMGRVL